MSIQKLLLDLGWFLFHGGWYWGSSASGLALDQGIAGEAGGSPGPGEPTELVPGGLEWLASRGEVMNSQGMKEEILPGCRDLEAALWRQLFRGVRSFLAWVYARTLAHHVQDAAGFLYFLSVSGIIIITF